MTQPQQQAADSHLLPFLLLCLRARWDPSTLEQARLMPASPNFDWQALPALAARHRLSALLYDVLRGQAWVPAPVLSELQAARYALAVRDLLLSDELCAALDRLAASEVDLLLLKGAALAPTVYGGQGLRPMEDLDLLIRPAAAAAALSALTQMGYGSTSVEVRPGSDLAFESEVRLTRSGRMPFSVELHWTLFDVPHYQQVLPIDWFWDSARTISLSPTVRARALGPEALLLHLCGHLLLHHGADAAALLWHHDVAEVLVYDRNRIDWTLLLGKAKECGLVLPLQQVLNRVIAGWHPPVPPDALARVNRLRPLPSEQRLVRERSAPRRPVARRFYSDLASMHGWGARLRYAWIQLFPSPAYMRARYGVTRTWLLPLYYPYRWWIGLRGLFRR